MVSISGRVQFYSVEHSEAAADPTDVPHRQRRTTDNVFYTMSITCCRLGHLLWYVKENPLDE